jgi:hypothetical protein
MGWEVMPLWFWVALPVVVVGSAVFGLVLGTYVGEFLLRVCPRGVALFAECMNWLDRLPGVKR